MEMIDSLVSVSWAAAVRGTMVITSRAATTRRAILLMGFPPAA
jgi:hypothetical protein